MYMLTYILKSWMASECVSDGTLTISSCIFITYRLYQYIFLYTLKPLFVCVGTNIHI